MMTDGERNINMLFEQMGKDEYRADAGWIEIIDELNTRLHKDAMDAQKLAK